MILYFLTFWLRIGFLQGTEHLPGLAIRENKMLGVERGHSSGFSFL
jgi:hypothetical protein